MKFITIKESSVKTNSNVSHNNLNERGSIANSDANSKKHVPRVVVTINDENKVKDRLLKSSNRVKNNDQTKFNVPTTINFMTKVLQK